MKWARLDRNQPLYPQLREPSADPPADEPRSYRLVIGSIDFVNGQREDPGASDAIIVVDLPQRFRAEPLPEGEGGLRLSQAPSAPLNSIWLRFDQDWSARLSILDGCGHIRRRAELPSWALFDRMSTSRRLCREIEAAGLDAARRSLIPLFVLASRRCHRKGLRIDSQLHFYSQVRFLGRDALFIRTTPGPYIQLGTDDEDVAARFSLSSEAVLEWFREACRLHRRNALFLNNHQCYYRRCWKDREIEVKFTLQPPVDLWDLTVRTYRCIEDGQMPGYIPEYRDEFQQWDYPSDLFEVTSPDAERGYVAFIPTTDGRFIVKRKRYQEDAMVRRETISSAIDLTDGQEAYLNQLGVQWRALPRLRRVRYDVDLESMRSGHIYGIFFDCTTVLDSEPGGWTSPSTDCGDFAPGAPTVPSASPDAAKLYQCEVEYRRSRTLLEPDEKIVFAEIAQILLWVRAFLSQRNVEYREGYYSKLSFLKDYVAARETAEVGERC